MIAATFLPFQREFSYRCRPVASIKWLGGLSEWPTLTSPPPSPASAPFLKHTFWYISNHYICLQYILFSVCVDFDEMDKLFGISFAENLADNCFWFSFSPTKSLVTSTRVRASVLSLWTYNIMRWFSLESPVVERKWTIWYVNKDLIWRAELPLCRFLFASYCCRWLQIIFISGLFLRLHQALCN